MDAFEAGKGQWRFAVWGTAGALLLLPLAAMELGAPGVHWTGSDFAVMGALLAAACGMWEVGCRMSRDRAYRSAVAIATVTGFALVWVNLAVGFIGETGDPANLMFAAVLAIGLVGAVIARFRAGGMARTMTAMAIAQALAGVVALALHRVGPVETIASGAFVASWLASAAVFRHAARRAA